MRDWKKYLSFSLVVLFAIISFHIRCGFSSISFTNDDWLIASETSDLPPDYLAWINFRNDNWHFPIGLFGNYSYPNVSSVANTGAIPLLAIPAKLLSPILPETFQYFGLWLLLCWILQGVFGYLLLSRFNPEKYFPNAIGACFFVIAAPFLDRIVHLNLCGQWIVLAGLYGYYSKSWNFKKQLVYQSTLQFLALSVHPYFIVFTFVTALAALWRYCRAEGVFNRGRLAAAATSLVLTIVVTAALLGMFSIGSGAQSWGFGHYSANINTFINPMGYSRFLSPMAQSTEGQYEGYAYLGLGVLLLIILALPLLNWRRSLTIFSTPLFWATLFLTLFAITTTVGLWGYSIKIPMLKFVEQTAGVFRASGRYIWQLFYIILIAIIAFWIRRADNKAIFILLPVLVLQLMELPALWRRHEFFMRSYTGLPSGQVWKNIMSEADLVCMVPPYRRHIISPGDNVHFEYIAGNMAKPISSGHLARFDQQVRWDFETKIQEFVSGKTDEIFDKAIFISDPGHMGELLPLLEKGFELYLLDRYVVLVPGKMLKVHAQLKAAGADKKYKVQSLEEYLELHRDHLVIMAVQDDAQTGLSEGVRSWAKNKGAKLAELPFRASYAAIFDKGKLIEDSLNVTQQVKFSYDHSVQKVEVLSGGNSAGNIASILINGKEHALNTRGINIVVVDSSGMVIDAVTFDTYSNSYRLIPE